MTTKKPRSRIRRLARWRVWIQALFLLVWMNPFLLRLSSICGPVFHCHSCPLATFVCPIGVLVHFSALHQIPYLAIGVLLLFGTLVGGFVCGWLCPFGFLQDLLGKVPLPKIRLPGYLGYLRYVVLLGLVVAVPYLFGEQHPVFFCRLCPAGALEAALPYSIGQAISGKDAVWPSAVKLSILGVLVASALVIWRPWCRLFCPLGAMYTLCNRFSLVVLRFNAASCTDCRRCESFCRYGAYANKRPAPSRCVRCLDCLNCPGVSLKTAFQEPGEVDDDRPMETLAPETVDFPQANSYDRG